MHYKAAFGEVDSTCRSKTTGPADSYGVRPSKSVSFTPLPNTSLFGTGQVRYTNNGVVCENSNHLYDQSMVQLLLTQNAEAGQGTSASNMLTDLSKNSGMPNTTDALKALTERGARRPRRPCARAVQGGGGRPANQGSLAVRLAGRPRVVDKLKTIFRSFCLKFMHLYGRSTNLATHATSLWLGVRVWSFVLFV